MMRHMKQTALKPGSRRRNVLLSSTTALMIFLQFVSVAYGQEAIDTTIEVEYESSQNPTQKEIFDRAIETVSKQYIEELIGETKAAKNQSLIKSRVLKNSGKYILFIKGQPSQAKKDKNLFPVQLKVSLKNLEAMLLQEGLLYKTDGPPKVLPVVSVLDRVQSQTYAWWSASNLTPGFTGELTKGIHQSLRDELRERGFFGLDPISADYKHQLPQALQSENPSTDDLLLLSDYFKANVITKGQVTLSPDRTRSDVYLVEVKLAAMHSSNGRIIGEVIRSYVSEPGPFQAVVKAKIEEVSGKVAADLASQILDAWKSGTFGATLIGLSVVGDLNYQQMALFKKTLLEQVKDVKNLKERLFEPGKVRYDMDSATSSEQLSQIIKQKSFSKFSVQVVRADSSGVELKVVPQK